MFAQIANDSMLVGSQFFGTESPMSRVARTALIQFAIVIAIVVGLLRPPFGVDAHAATGSTSHIEAVQHSDDHAGASHGHLHDHDGDSSEQHNAADHSHVPSSMPPSMTAFVSPSGWMRPADFVGISMRSASISFDRPPRPTVFA
ncbi:hypothetical protein E0H22_15410 [Rhodopseudomonas boonkerdii]|uniref:hypothetical protein n=1 Tax=Rhodopseudomonas boonkerdii TaxID=475937 RepID=UPI001E36859A|nr:hypothetical protein [Rhodopseudomonas boonkerdii]UGV26951.1 hypothetical protein E0H22_15410 [Rhodopseudomonas boonkerdii]